MEIDCKASRAGYFGRFEVRKGKGKAQREKRKVGLCNRPMYAL